MKSDARERFDKIYAQAYEKVWRSLDDVQRRRILLAQEYRIQSDIDEEGCSAVFIALKLALWSGDTHIPTIP